MLKHFLLVSFLTVALVFSGGAQQLHADGPCFVIVGCIVTPSGGACDGLVFCG